MRPAGMLHRGRLIGAFVLAVVAAACGGCYKHVVRSEGFGGRSVDIYEPNVPEKGDQLDQLMWGTDEKKQRDWRNR